MRFNGETEDLDKVRAIGARWGYGNCIQYLQHAWAETLIKDLGREQGARHSGMGEEEVKAFVKGFTVLKR